jgi:heat shock protein HslJ
MGAVETSVTWRALLILMTIATVAIAGCGGAGRGANPQATSSSGGVWGRTFVSISATVGGSTKELVAGTSVQLTFHRGEVRAHAGCNQLFGRASTDGDRLVVSEVGGTLMACDQGLADQEAWLRNLLEGGPRWRLSDDNLVLNVGDTELRLVDVRAAKSDQPLIGPRWQARSLVEKGTEMRVPPDVDVYVLFRDLHAVEGSTGCRTFRGTAVPGAGTVHFSGVSTESVHCPERLRQLDVAVLNLLRGDVAFRIAGDELVLTHPGGRSLRFVSAADGGGHS